MNEDLSNWASEKGFVKPKVAVAIVIGWSPSEIGSEGKKNAIDFFETTMKVSAATFFDVNTALTAIQDHQLQPLNFRVNLYFVETANQCD